MGYPSVYPTRTTIYYPEKCFNGYTVFPTVTEGVILIDMNGNVVRQFKGVHGFPSKILPGGYFMGSTGHRDFKYGYQDMIDLVQIDFDGNIVWRFNKYEIVKDGRKRGRWIARLHHDYQREGNPVGYYVPGMDPLVDRGNTLILCHKNLTNKKISEHPLLDDTIIEVTWDGDIIWEWTCSDHFEEMGFDEEAKNITARNPNIIALSPFGGYPLYMGDWMHINSISTLGPNKWYDSGDERFHPDNIVWDGRQTNIIAITDKKTGKIVWQIGPDYNATPELRKMQWIIGQHHAHLIPKGLPGEGNILVYDNGGWGGYGAPNPCSSKGLNNALRDYSRVLEFNPVTLEVVWKYTAREAGFAPVVQDYKFYSGFISSAQRLPNGNTLVTEGSDGRIFEITPDYEIVWEYICPYLQKTLNLNMVYRAYRVPYEWVPQLETPKETEIPRSDNSNFWLMDYEKTKSKTVVNVKSGSKIKPITSEQLCVVPRNDD